jgi:hypothetical protein
MDIQPGDVVVCVDAEPDRHDPLAYLLSEGKTYRVAAVGEDKHGAMIAFRCLPSNLPGHGWAWAATRFRKIRPADPEFIEQIKRVRIGEPA